MWLVREGVFMEKQRIHLKEIRELATRFTPEQIEGCIMQQIEEGTNSCDVKGPIEHVINELSKAEFVREMMEAGMTLNEAVRELAKRIRLVQMAFKEEKE
jgi:hypothetical protein